MNIRGRNGLVVLLVALLLVATGWALSFKPEPPADFTFVNDTEIKSIDPAVSNGQPELRVIMALFEGLVNWDPKTLEPIPGIAESWDISPDRLTYTFHFRKDAKWSSGTPVTPHDFLWQWRRILDPSTVREYSYMLWYIKNAQRYTEKDFTVGDLVEVELHERPKGDLPFARGEVVRGKLLAKIDVVTSPAKPVDSDAAESMAEANPKKKEKKESVYLIETDGKYRLFQPVRTRDLANWTAPKLDSKALVAGMKSGVAPEATIDSKLPSVEACKIVLLDFNEVGAKAIDDRTLQIELRAPTPFFLFICGYYPLYPTNPLCVETYGYPGWTKPENIVTNGAFKLQSHKVRERIRLVKNDQYWNSTNVRLNIIDVLAVESLVTSLNLYLTGQVDWITRPPATAVPELLNAKRLDFDPKPGMETYFYRINCTKPPLNNPLVRKALALAVNKQEIVDTVTHGGELPALSVVPPGLGGYEPASMGKYDPEQARKLLAEAGYPGGRGLGKIEILYNTEEVHQSIAELIQAQWKENLGIDVGLQNMEWNAYQSAQIDLQYQVCRAGWIGDYLDPNTFLDMWMTANTNNQTGWSNKQYDTLMIAAEREADPTKRCQLLHQAETILMDELPIIPIYYYVTSNLVRPYVKGFYQNPLDVHPLDPIWIDNAEKKKFLEVGGRG